MKDLKQKFLNQVKINTIITLIGLKIIAKEKMCPFLRHILHVLGEDNPDR